MARTKKALHALKAPRLNEEPEPVAEPECEAMDNEDDEDDGLDGWDMHELLVATLREQRLLLQAVKDGNAGKHDIKRIDNQGSCGIPSCRCSGARFACVSCKVRLCRNTWCLNAHLNELQGRVISDKFQLNVSADQGEKKEVPGRAQWDED